VRRAGRLAPLVGALVVLGVVLAVHGARSRANARADAGTPEVTVTLPTGGGSAPSLTVTTPLVHQSARMIAASAAHAGSTAASVAVGARAVSQAMPAGFVGLSIEYNAVEPYAAAGARLRQALANLAPGQRPYIRVGGDSADHSTVPIPGFSNTGVFATWGPRWEAAARALASGADAHMVFDLDLEVNQARVPQAEARTMLADVGARYVSAFELGNEPSLYAKFPWYAFHHRPFYARARATWSPATYIKQLRGFVGSLGGVALWGPALPANSTWWTSLPQIAAAVPHLTQITDHAYPLNCYGAKSAPTAPSQANLLAPSSSVGLAAEVAPEVAFARKTGRGVRIDEINTVACAGADAITTFASALWAIEAAYALDRGGVSGVDIHTFPTAAYRLFSFTPDAITVADEYYGWMLFARANPPGSHQLTITTSGNPHVRAFATRAGASTRVVLIDDSPVHSATVTLAVPHATRLTVEALRSPGLSSRGGVTFAGLSIARASGRLSDGSATASALAGAGRFSIGLAPGSADLVTVTH
jgi:hypothetical protein